jgi:pimeloyl-ACP methyl ester carboxylesterase
MDIPSMHRLLYSLVALLATVALVRADSEPAPRRVYALHSGVHIYLSHPWKNHAAEVLRDELRRRQVPERDLVVLDNPFPEATWRSMFPRDGLIMFLESMTPSSRVAQDAYLRMHKAFQAHDVGPRDEIVWIGHSAGGQMGMTMAQLSADLVKHPALAQAAQQYRFHTIVTLGTPVGCNEVPDDVRVRHYFSPQDKVVRIVCDGGPWLLPSLGYRCNICPATPAPRKNCLTRCWYGVEHPDWIYEQRVLDRVLQDVSGPCPSWWSPPHAAERPGAALAQLLGQMLEEEHCICLEELPK